jgi:hypothetical protein
MADKREFRREVIVGETSNDHSVGVIVSKDGDENAPLSGPTIERDFHQDLDRSATLGHCAGRGSRSEPRVLSM